MLYDTIIKNYNLKKSLGWPDLARGSSFPMSARDDCFKLNTPYVVLQVKEIVQPSACFK